MKLVISIDVEEEGLFSGAYPRTPSGVKNVSQLKRLEFIPQEFGFPLTLLVTYQVARDPSAREVLAHFRDRHGAELGAHLHPWNTPPFADLPQPEPVRSELLPPALLRGKLAALTASLSEASGAPPLSFRMGRFDWGPRLLALLPEFGFKVDSSMVPLTQKVGGPDQFLVPADPFRLQAAPGEGPGLLEVPLTLVPLWEGAAAWTYRLSRLFPGKRGERVRSWFPYLAALGIQPVWYPLTSMRWAVRLHRRRGGRVLTMFFHSSELAPGGSPHFPTEAAVGRFICKIRAFLTWLRKTGPVKGITLSELAQDCWEPWEGSLAGPGTRGSPARCSA